jgi:hypothetical protein
MPWLADLQAPRLPVGAVAATDADWALEHPCWLYQGVRSLAVQDGATGRAYDVTRVQDGDRFTASVVLDDSASRPFAEVLARSEAPVVRWALSGSHWTGYAADGSVSVELTDHLEPGTLLDPCRATPPAPVVLPPIEVPPGPVTTAAEWQQQHPSWLYYGARSGRLGEYAGLLRHLGDVPLPDGRLAAADWMLADERTRPFLTTLAPGTYPVAAAVAVIGESHHRVAALVLVAGQAPVVRWSMALTAEQDVSALPPGRFVGYGVDCGVGSFFSPDVLEALHRVCRADDGMLETPMDKAIEASRIHAGFAAPEPGALPLAVCQSGWGDGTYPTWMGHAADGSVSVVMTDFLVPDDDPTRPATTG